MPLWPGKSLLVIPDAFDDIVYVITKDTRSLAGPFIFKSSSVTTDSSTILVWLNLTVRSLLTVHHNH